MTSGNRRIPSAFFLLYTVGEDVDGLVVKVGKAFDAFRRGGRPPVSLVDVRIEFQVARYLETDHKDTARIDWMVDEK